MSLIKPAPVSIPFSNWQNVPANTTVAILGPHSATPAISVVRGIDISNPTYVEGANFQVYLSEAIVSPVTAVLFQGSVYATSQANFQWRGELPIFDVESLTMRAFNDPFDVVIWGCLIPAISFSP